jgi:exosortase
MEQTTTSGPGARPGRMQAVLFAAALLLLLWLAWPMMAWLGSVFRNPKEDMSHGWLVPLFSLFLLWRRRTALRQAADGPSLAGALLCLPFLLLLWLGERGGQVRLSQVAVYGLAWSLGYAFWGRQVAGLIFFPVVFLGFTIPLGFLDFFTVRLRLLTAALAGALLNGIGIPVVRAGTGLHSLAGEGFSLDIADPCSGLRSIFALAAITAAYAYLTQRTLWQKWLLFACSVPLAVIGNIARIFTIAIVARYFGQEAGVGFYHDYSAYLVFVVGTLLMMQAGTWIGRLGGNGGTVAAEPAPPAAPPAAPAAAGGAAVRALILAGLPLLLLATGLLLRRLPPPQIEPADFLAAELPAAIGAMRGSRPWYCHNDQCLHQVEDTGDTASPAEPPICPRCGGPMREKSLGEETILPADTILLKRNYLHPAGGLFRVVVVLGGARRQSIHRPELCLPAQGFAIERAETVTMPLADGTPLAVRLVEVRRRGAGGGAMGQAYFFVSPRHQTASHFVRIMISARDRAFENRVTRWAMVTITADEPFDTPERRRRLHEFIGELYPRLRAAPPGESGRTTMGTGTGCTISAAI